MISLVASISCARCQSPVVETISYLALAGMIESADEHSDGPWDGVMASSVCALRSEHAQTVTKMASYTDLAMKCAQKVQKRLFEAPYKL